MVSLQQKICDAWTKKRGRSERQNFEGIFTKPIIERLNKLLPSFDFDVEDVIAMFQLCGAWWCLLSVLQTSLSDIPCALTV